LKALPQTKDAEAARLRPLVRRWHDAALPFMGQVAFEETWACFLEAWPRVKHAAGAGPFEQLWEKSATAPQPGAARAYDDPHLRRLVTFCRLLHKHAKGRPFPLDCRRVALLLGVHRNKVWRWLTLVLAADGVLQLVAPGNWSQGRANEYRYVESNGKRKS
jgi:hypothetical protein